MSNQGERFKGKAEELGGGIEKGVGKILGNEKLQVKGAAHEAEGEARQEVAKAAERLKGAGEQIKGVVKGAVGKVIGNDQMRVEGEAKKLEGEARKKANQ